jgi:hypothetical protein
VLACRAPIGSLQYRHPRRQGRFLDGYRCYSHTYSRLRGESSIKDTSRAVRRPAWCGRAKVDLETGRARDDKDVTQHAYTQGGLRDDVFIDTVTKVGLSCVWQPRVLQKCSTGDRLPLALFAQRGPPASNCLCTVGQHRHVIAVGSQGECKANDEVGQRPPSTSAAGGQRRAERVLKCEGTACSTSSVRVSATKQMNAGGRNVRAAPVEFIAFPRSARSTSPAPGRRLSRRWEALRWDNTTTCSNHPSTGEPNREAHWPPPSPRTRVAGRTGAALHTRRPTPADGVRSGAEGIANLDSEMDCTGEYTRLPGAAAGVNDRPVEQSDRIVRRTLARAHAWRAEPKPAAGEASFRGPGPGPGGFIVFGDSTAISHN